MHHQLINQYGKPVIASNAASVGGVRDFIRDVVAAERERCSKSIFETAEQFVGDTEAQDIFTAAGHVVAGVPDFESELVG